MGAPRRTLTSIKAMPLPTLLTNRRAETETGKDHGAEELYQQVMAINDFDEAVAFIQSLPPTGPRSADNSTKLRFYSYFKQGSVGPCKKHGGPQPWMAQPVNRAKWDAWNALGDMPSSEAKTRYVDTLHELAGEWKPAWEAAGMLQRTGLPNEGGCTDSWSILSTLCLDQKVFCTAVCIALTCQTSLFRLY